MSMLHQSSDSSHTNLSNLPPKHGKREFTPKPLPPQSAQLEKIGSQQNGRMKFYCTKRGFGFIVPDSGATDVFLHQGALGSVAEACLTPGRLVSFQICKQLDGKHKGTMCAINIKLLR